MRLSKLFCILAVLLALPAMAFAAQITVPSSTGLGVILTGLANGNYTPQATSAIRFFTVTTTGSSGAATYSGGTLNIPQYSGGGGSGLSTTSPIASSNLLEYSASGAGSAFGVATSTLTAGTGLTGSFTQIGSGGSVALATPVSAANGGLGADFSGASSGVMVWAHSLGFPTITTTFSSLGSVLTGQLAPASGGTGQDSSAWSGLGAINAGVWSALSTTSLNASITGSAGSVANTLTISSPLTGSSYNGSSGVSIGCTTAAAGTAGCLNSSDWSTFNNKISWGAATSTSANQIVYTDNNGKFVSAASSTLFGATTPGYVWSYQNGAWGAFATSTGGGGGTVTSVATTWPIIGGTITNTGTLTFGGLSTSTAAVVGNIPYFSGVNTFANVATGTVSAGSSAITVTAGRSAIGGALAIDCATSGSGQNGCLSSTDWSTFNNKIGWGQATSTSANQIVYTNAAGKLVSAASSSLALPNTALANSTISGVALGSTLNAVTFNSSGGASPGSTYTGASTLTVDYSTLGAQAAGTGTSGNCVKWGAGNTITDFGSACSSGGGGTWPFTPSTYNGVANQSTTTALWLKNTMVLASTTFFTMASTTNLEMTLYANEQPGADIGAQINNAYAALPSGGGTIVVPTSASFSTEIQFTTDQKRVILQCNQGVVLTWTGSANSTSTLLNYGYTTLGFGQGIKNCKFSGPSKGGTTVGIELGGSNGAQGSVLEGIHVTGFGTGIVMGANTWGQTLRESLLQDNGRNLQIYASNNSGENPNFINNIFADGSHTSTSSIETCVYLNNSATASANFTNNAFDDCGFTQDEGNVGTNIIGGHFEDPDPTNYHGYRWITDNTTAAMTVEGTQFYLDQTHASALPFSAIYNLGRLNLYGIKFDNEHSISNTDMVYNSGGSAALSVYGWYVNGTAFTNVATSSLFINADETNSLFLVGGTASSTSLIVSGSGGVAGCATFASDGTISNTHSACGGSGSAYPFTPLTNYNITTSATTSALWVKIGLYASSTSAFDQINVGSSTISQMATSTFYGNLEVKGHLQDDSVTSALILDNSSGLAGPYGGTTCTNQFVRSLNAAGSATCATVANTDLSNSTIVVNGVTLTLGDSADTITAASSTLLTNFNHFTKNQTIDFASSTAMVISATGELVIPNAANPTLANTGELAINTTAASTSLRFYDGTAERTLNVDHVNSFSIASTTALVTNGLYVVGTTYAQLGTGAASTTIVQCSTAPSWTSMTTAFVMGNNLMLGIGTTGTTTIHATTLFHPLTVLGAECLTDSNSTPTWLQINFRVRDDAD